MVKSFLVGTATKAVYQDLDRSWWNWDTFGMKVTVKRRERESLTSQWFEQVQDLTTSYYVVDVRGRVSGTKITELFIGGVYPNGDACIERWIFTYPLQPVPIGGAYVPISQRRLPKCQRSEVLRTTSYGLIRCVEPDPEGRFVLFLTRDNPILYRKELPAGPITIELDAGNHPFLSQVKDVSCRQHVTEGRQYHLMASLRWQIDAIDATDTLILKDGNNDGVFDAPMLLSKAGWNAAGYDAEVWSRF